MRSIPRASPLALAALCGLAGCSSTNLEHAYALHESGAFPAAADEIVEVELARQVDRIWVLLERGKMLQDAGRWQASIDAFREADELFELLDESAVISAGAIANMSTALVTDDRSLDYVGNGFDRILLGAAMIVNHLELGDFETAAVYARRQLTRQREMQELHAQRIEQRAADDAAAQESRAKTSTQDVEQQAGYQQQLAVLDGWTNPAYADFSVPYGYFAAALALGAAARYGEQERMLADLAGMLPDDPHVRALLGERGLGRRVYVLFENGVAPMRVDKSFFYISPLGATSVPVPDLVVRDQGRSRALRITAGSETHETTLLDRVDQMMANEFKADLAGIWLRAIVAVVLKEVATKQAYDSAGGWGILIGSIVKTLVRPDTRAWRSLPGEHQVAVFERPASGRVGLSLDGPYGTPLPPLEVVLPGEGACLLWVRTTAPGGMAVYPASLQHVLRDAGAGWSNDAGAPVDSPAANPNDLERR